MDDEAIEIFQRMQMKAYILIEHFFKTLVKKGLTA